MGRYGGRTRLGRRPPPDGDSAALPSTFVANAQRESQVKTQHKQQQLLALRDQQTVRIISEILLNMGPTAAPARRSEALVELRKVVAVRGLVNNELRRRVWPKLLDIPIENHTQHVQNLREKSETLEHRDSHVVEVDVERSLWRFTTKHTDDERQLLRESLKRMINGVICEHQQTLYYYQGFHDVASVFLMVAGEELGSILLEKAALHYFRDALKPNLDRVLQQLQMLLVLVREHDPEVADFLESCNVPPYYALSWVITWFSHNVHDLASAARLFDLFLVSTPLMPLYISAALLVSHKEELLASSEDRDQAEVHHFLNTLDLFSGVDTSEVVFIALRLHRGFPPRKLITTCSSAIVTRQSGNVGHRASSTAMAMKLDLRTVLALPLAFPRWVLRPISGGLTIRRNDAKDPNLLLLESTDNSMNSEVARYERRADQMPRDELLSCSSMIANTITDGELPKEAVEHKESPPRSRLVTIAPAATLFVGAVSIAVSSVSGLSIAHFLEDVAEIVGSML